jgi:precorrin-2 dehydrogenase/sirohydrochlorin ferrochelatase/precorrin-6A/cobalt-precorrin-6A reductase
MKLERVLIIGGTTEGRMLASKLSEGREVHMTVATDYSLHLLEKEKAQGVHIYVGRLQIDELRDLTYRIQPICIIDSTHPYAREISKNTRQVADSLGIPFYRVIRKKLGNGEEIRVSSTAEAAEFLKNTKGNILLTCGSKEMECFTSIAEYQERIFARILPNQEVLQKCTNLGFMASHLALVQGPYTKEFNKSYFQMVNARYLVTKDSGVEGGTREKIQAADELGIQVILIDRAEEDGYEMNELLEFLKIRYGWEYSDLNVEDVHPSGVYLEDSREIVCKSHFPFFFDIRGRNIKVFGGGHVAYRRLSALMPFDCRLEVITPEWQSEIQDIADSGRIDLIKKKYNAGDCYGADYVLAATDDAEVNDQIWMECKLACIPVNVAHQKEKSDFYFPGILSKGMLTVGIIAGGMDHKLAKETVKVIRNVLNQIEEENDREEKNHYW